MQKGSNTPGAASSAADDRTSQTLKDQALEGSGGMFEGLGVSGAVLVRAGRAWNVFWVRLGYVLQVSWGHLAASWEGLGGILGSLEGFLGGFWEYF